MTKDEGYELFSSGWDAAVKYMNVKNSIKRGEIKNVNPIFREFVMNADITIRDGSTVQLAFSVNFETFEPMVTLGERTFVLSWDDIVELADAAGLFEDSEVTE